MLQLSPQRYGLTELHEAAECSLTIRSCSVNQNSGHRPVVLAEHTAVKALA